jgi:hypothetical protein
VSTGRESTQPALFARAVGSEIRLRTYAPFRYHGQRRGVVTLVLGGVGLGEGGDGAIERVGGT